MDNKLKHLEFIQTAINRMASNSFIIKSWSITLVTIIFSLFSSLTSPFFITVLPFSVTIFWLLDGYFLSRERAYRVLFDRVRRKKEKDINFSMKIPKIPDSNCSWLHSIFSHTLLIFYLPIIAITIALIIIKFSI